MSKKSASFADTILNGVIDFLPALPIFINRLVWNTVQKVHGTPLGNSKYRENWCCESHRYLRIESNSVLIFYIFPDMDKFDHQTDCHKMFLINTSFVKIGGVKAIFYVVAWIHFCPYFPHLFSSLSGFRYKRSENVVVEHLWLSWKSPWRRSYYPCGCKWN